MDVELLAFDSMGVRSQATIIYTPDVAIAIDPAVALAPRRYSLPPHIREVKLMLNYSSIIEDKVKDVDIIIITHYHYDHHDPGRYVSLDVYRDKLLILKDPKNKINMSQRIRSSRFIKLVKDKVRELKIADANSFKIRNTEIVFSEPLPHGTDSRLGYVVSVVIKYRDEVFLFSSDVEGPALPSQLSFIKSMKPNIAIIDGPLLYMLGYRYSEQTLTYAIESLKELVKSWELILILDHHFARDLRCLEYIRLLNNEGRSTGSKVMTAAEFMKQEPTFLEAKRIELYKEDPTPGLELLSQRHYDI